MKRIVAFLVWMLYLNTSFLSAQTPHFQQYYPLKKNQPVEIHTLFQDTRGYVWLGTDKGLFRFDGLEYIQFTEEDSLPDENVTAVAEDSLGRIWMGHENGQISYFDNGMIRLLESPEGFAIEPVSDMLFDRKGRLWFSTMDDGLYYFMNNRMFRIDEQEGLPDLFIYDLFEDTNGNILAGTDAGLAICTLTGQEVTIDVIDTQDGMPDIIIKKITRLQHDTLALATEDAGVLKYNIKTNQFKPLIETPWPYGSISDLVVKENQLWISTPRNGLAVYDRMTHRLKLFSQFSEGQSLRSINSLMKDREGNIWSGTRSGLVRTLGDAVEHLESLEPSKDNNVLALAVDAQDRIWFSTRKGLFVRDYHLAGTATVTHKLQNTPFRNSTIISLYADEQGFIWAGLYGNGLLRMHPVTGQVTHFNKELRNGNVLSITGRGQAIWVATLGGGTSINYEKGEYEFRNYSTEDGLSSDFVYQVFIDSRGRTWFATDGKGVTMLDHRGFHHYEDGLTSKVVYSFAEDFEHTVWVTSQDNGIYRFDGTRFVTVPELRLRDNSIQSLHADDHGNLIAIHNFGIDVFNIRKKQMRYWGEETGIRDKHPNLNAIARDQYGQFYFGTSRGIIKLSLNNDTVMAVPQPAIDAVRVYDEIVDLSKSPRLNYDENNITVHYVGFWYQNSENLNYRYKLDNYDLEWIATSNRQVTYSRLPPGDYVFRVMVSDTEDFSHARESSVNFAINPPFWRTSSFYVFIIGLFVISAYGLIKYRERRLLDDKLVLEGRVEERTKEIQIKTEEIQAQNEEIMAQAEEIQGINENLEMLVKQRTAELEKKNQALEEYAFINAHKLRGPVASILGLLNLLAKANPDDDSKVIREHLQQSATKLDDVVRSITTAIEKADNKFQ
jgi:ligand-binding sensor domain-containing protein